MALLIKVDGTHSDIQGINSNGSLTYEQLQNAIGGGYIQSVGCDPKVTGGYDHYYCDEEGKLKNLSVNREATKLSTYTALDDVLVGDVIFCKTVGVEMDEDA